VAYLKATKVEPNQAEVTLICNDEDVKMHVVYLDQHMCTCRELQVSGKPCPHALLVITTESQPDMEKYVDVAYSVQRFPTAYVGMIHVINNKSRCLEVDKGFKLLPPIGQRRGLSGRQSRKRVKGCLERSGKATRQVTLQGLW